MVLHVLYQKLLLESNTMICHLHTIDQWHYDQWIIDKLTWYFIKRWDTCPPFVVIIDSQYSHVRHDVGNSTNKHLSNMTRVNVIMNANSNRFLVPYYNATFWFMASSSSVSVSTISYIVSIIAHILVKLLDMVKSRTGRIIYMGQLLK